MNQIFISVETCLFQFVQCSQFFSMKLTQSPLLLLLKYVLKEPIKKKRKINKQTKKTTVEVIQSEG